MVARFQLLWFTGAASGQIPPPPHLCMITFVFPKAKIVVNVIVQFLRAGISCMEVEGQSYHADLAMSPLW